MVEEGFEAVRDVFAANFELHGDVGAAFAAYHEGRKVVDLWGGVADESTGRLWSEDSLEVVFSTTKGATAACALLLAQRGELSLDAPVAQYWPEFAAEGKGSIPVRWLLSHRAGLPVVDRVLSARDVLAWDPIVEALAAQKPVWEPGTAHGYHALTYGYLVGEVVRRVSGRSVGRFFAEEIAGPLGLDFWIGLPESEDHRVAPLVVSDVAAADVDLSTLPEDMRAIVAEALDPASLTNRALSVTTPPLDFGGREVRGAEVPAAGGVCTARSLAKMYAAFIGDVDGVRVLDAVTVADATIEQSNGPDEVLKLSSRFGLGFWLPCDVVPLGGPRSFGHPGAGGSLGFADPDSGLAFGYIMNKMGGSITGDQRTLTLIEACASAV